MTRLAKIDGQIVDLDDPNTLKTRAQKAAAGVPRGSMTPDTLSPEAKRRADAYESAKNPWYEGGSIGKSLQENVGRPLGHGVFLGFDDELRAGLHAAGNAVGNLVGLGNGESIGQDYVNARDADREITRRQAARNPGTSTAAELGGALVNPVGDGAAGLSALAKGADLLGMSRAAKVAAGLGRTVEAAPVVVKAALAGANQGALNAAGNADNLSDVPNALFEGGVTGGLAGGALGGLVHGGAKVVQTLRDAGAAAAPRIAASRVGDLLDKGGMTPAGAASEIAATDAANLNPLQPGQGAMVGELTPGLRARSVAISKNVDVPSSNTLIERGQSRIADRGQQFANQFRGTADDAGGTLNFDAPEHIDSIVGTRKQAGQADYAKGGALDAPITQTPELANFLRDAPDETHAALRSAYKQMALRREPAGVMMPMSADGTIEAIPNMRAFDYAKREFDVHIGQAMRSGNSTTAEGLSQELGRLKEYIGNANPEYRDVLATQRDLFQKQRAAEIGQDALKRISSDPRAFMKDLLSQGKDYLNDARIGIVDAIINNTRADPVQMYQSLTRTPAQKKVIEFALGGPDKLAEFETYIGREARARETDKKLAPGYQPDHSYLNGAGGDASPHLQLAQQAGRGFAFGGGIGAVTSGMRYLAKLATSNSNATQEEIAKILLGKGEGLAERVQGAKDFATGRAARNQRRALAAAKIGAYQGVRSVEGGN